MKLKKLILALMILMTIGSAAAKTVYVSGPVKSEKFDHKNFTMVDVQTYYNVYMTQGNREEVVIETYESLMPYAKVEKEGQRLKISLDKKLNRINWKGKDQLLNVYITVKDIEKIVLSGACDLFLQSPLQVSDLRINASGASDLDLMTVKGKNIEIITSGASDIKRADLDAKKVYINASGASDGDVNVIAEELEIIASGSSDFNIDVKVNDLDIRAIGSSDFIARGESRRFKVDVSGSSDMKAFDLISDAVIVKASGSSYCQLYARHSIEASGSGTSSIYYKGNPDKTSIDITGVSSIRSK